MYKKLIVALLAVFAFGAVATSNAFAGLLFVAKSSGTKITVSGFSQNAEVRSHDRHRVLYDPQSDGNRNWQWNR